MGNFSDVGKDLVTVGENGNRKSHYWKFLQFPLPVGGDDFPLLQVPFGIAGGDEQIKGAADGGRGRLGFVYRNQVDKITPADVADKAGGAQIVNRVTDNPSHQL